MAIPEDHLAKFHKMTDAKEIWEAIKSRFGGNDESKKMHKYILKQQFESFSVSNLDGLHKVSLIMRTKPGVDTLSFDDLYNNLRVFESDIKGSTASSSSTQNYEYRSKGIKNAEGEMQGHRNKAKDNRRRPGKQEEPNSFVILMGRRVDWTLVIVRSSDVEDSPVHDRFKNVEGMHAVPPPMTGNYMPPRPDREVDDSMFTYGPKQSKTSESDTQTSNFDSCESNSSVETLESVPEPVVVEPKVVSQPKVWSDAPIIEEYESDSDDDYVIQPLKEQEKPSFAFVNTIKHVKTPRETIKEQNTYSPSPKADKRDWNGLISKRLGLGYGFTKKACFVCGSFSHLIRDYDFHEKRMAKQVELNKKKGKGTGQGENRPVWNNVQRLNHQNKFVPKAVLTKTGIFPVNTARQNLSSQAATTSTARKVNTARPIVNEIRPRNNFYKSHSPIRRPFNRTAAPKAKFSNQKVNTAEIKAVSAVGGKRETAVKPSAGCNWRPKRHYWNKFSKYNGGSNSRKCDNPQRALKNKGIVDSGCSRHMTGNKAYLAEYQDYNGGPVAFGGSKGYITGKGKIKTGKLDFEDVCFVKELQHFNLFSVSQMCDKKNKVLFTDTECLVLSSDFKLPDENQVLLRIPRQNNMYSFNLENIVPSGGLACLIAKAIINESNKWHRRLGHVNFKNLNKLVKGNLVRGLPSKIFQNDHTCVACQKGKQHKASCKAKIVSSISQPLQLLHMDLFGPTSVRSINHKTYCLVITDDYSRFSWVFFLRTKDETSGILKDFIRQIENQLNQKVKTIRCDNGTKFKNMDIIEFCGSKGIKREYSNARTPQQNGVAKRKNMTLIEAGKKVLVTKPQNKTPYELITGKGPNWLFDLDYLTDSMNYQPVRSENQANKTAGPNTQNNIDAGNSEMEAEPAQDYFVLPIWSSYTSTVKSSETKNEGKKPNRDTGLKTNEEPVDKEDQAFLEELERLKRQEKEANDAAEALRKEFAQDTEDLLLQARAARATSTNTVNTASTPVSTDSPSNIFSTGGPALNITNQDDSQIPALEDIYDNPSDVIFTNASYDDEGAVADFTNLESTMNVSPIPTSRIHSSHPTTQILGDPKLAVQTRRFPALEEPVQFKIQSYQMDVKSASCKAKIDKEVYFSTSSFVDPNCPKKVYKVVKALYGLHQAPRACQDKYVAEILKKFDFASVKTASTPIETQKSLTKDEEAANVDVHLYRSMIGSLMYLTASRPDIMFAVCACSRFQVTPKTSHLNAVKRIFRYLKGKPKLPGITKCPSFDLEAYSYSDYAGANLDRKSTIGGCQFLGRRLISWQCKKQTIVATSTTEAEYVAAANCCGQVLWIQNQMLDYGFNFMNTKIYIDNESTICIVKNPVFHSKTKHIEIRHHFIRDAYEKKLIQVLKIHTDDNVADLLTKAFDVSRHQELASPEQTVSGKDFSNPLIVDSLLKTIWFINAPCFCNEALAIPGQTTTGKELSNPLMAGFLAGSHIRYALTANPTIYVSLVEQFWQTVTIKTLNDGEQQVTVTVDGHKFAITEASVRRHLQLADVDGISSLLNTEIFEQLSLIGYLSDNEKLTFKKAQFSPKWRFLIHTILHCLSPKKTSWE
ncbi:putative ribonuclease H-like domain-containing protein [Tanacetum coccineum]